MKNTIVSTLFTVTLIMLTAATSVRGAGYYIDPVSGNDDNNGSSRHPWKSFRNVSSYYKPSYRPAGWVELKPGDCIYLGDGVYDEILHPGDGKNGPEGGGSFIAYFRGKRADGDSPFQLKAHRGRRPILDPGGKGIGLSIMQLEGRGNRSQKRIRSGNQSERVNRYQTP